MTAVTGSGRTALTAASHGGVGVYEWDPGTRRLWWDETLARIFHADDPAEPPLETWLRRIHPDERELVRDTFSGFDTAETVYRLLLDDGTVRYILGRATYVLRDPDGIPRKLLGVMLDVTETQQVGARLTSILESMSDGFVALDADFRVTYVNAQAEQHMGVPRSELLGQTVWEMFAASLGTRFQAMYERVMQTRVPESLEEYYPAPLDVWVEVRAQPSADGIVLYFQDVTARHAEQAERERLLAAERGARLDAELAKEQLAHQATHDGLTGLLNRTELERRLAHHLERGPWPVTLLFLDLDRFKLVNDSLGHGAGDDLLLQVAGRLEPLVRADDAVARLGGDEFVVLLTGQDAAAAQEVAERLLDADAHADLLERVALEAGLRAALATGHLELHYQPAYDLGTGRVVGVEALARWHDPLRGMVLPDVFVPLAEDTGLIGELGAHVVRTACAQAARWTHVPDLVVWVNVSGRQLEAPGLAEQVLAELAAAGVPPTRFGIEVTESVFLDELTAATELARLAEAGVSVAIDDFGMGYSSIARLGSLPVHVLKIDRSFVADLDSERGRAAVHVIVLLAHTYGLSTVAEGVETPQQLELLRAAGSDAASGFLLARPAPAADLPLGG